MYFFEALPLQHGNEGWSKISGGTHVYLQCDDGSSPKTQKTYPLLLEPHAANPIPHHHSGVALDEYVARV